MTPAFLDANVFLYAAGQDHVLKQPCVRVLTLVARHRSAFLTDSEVFQEILHRSLSIKRWESMRERFREFMALMEDRTEALVANDVAEAAVLVDRFPALADRYPAVAARDLVHVAVMQRLRVTRIISADAGFDDIDGIERLDPMLVDDWAHLVTETR